MSDITNPETAFGSLLKKARQEKSLSLEEVCTDLKINLKLLRNLEDSNLEDLPKRAFTKGLIKSYTKYLAVDDEEILALYNSNFESNAHMVKTGVLKQSDNHDTVFISDVFQKTVIPVSILFFTIGGVFAVSLFLKSYNPSSTFNNASETSKQDLSQKKDLQVATQNNKETSNTNKPTSVMSTTDTEALKINPVNKNSGALVSAATNKEEKAPVQLNTLTVEPLDKTALMIKTNLDEKAVRASLKPNKVRTFKFESAEIKYFDAGAVNLLFNGKDIGVPGNFGEQKVVRYPSEIAQ